VKSVLERRRRRLRLRFPPQAATAGAWWLTYWYISYGPTRLFGWAYRRAP